jgi:hypothetical protein
LNPVDQILPFRTEEQANGPGLSKSEGFRSVSGCRLIEKHKVGSALVRQRESIGFPFVQCLMQKSPGTGFRIHGSDLNPARRTGRL